MRHSTISCRTWLPATAGLAIAAAIAQPGCIGTDCNDIGWNEGLTVDLVADGGYADGSYEVVAVADGVTLRGGFSIAGDQAVCVDECQLVAEGNDRGFVGTLQLSGSVASPRIETAMLNVFRRDGDDVDGGPDRLELSVRRHGVELTSLELEPTYRREELAGPGCGVATQAKETVTVPPPSDLCPETRPSDGERCDAPPALRCEGTQDLTTCDGRYGGTRRCNCEDGVWSCPNIFCPVWCPETRAEAQAGAACDAGTASGACYYEGDAGDTVLCSCREGVTACS